MKTVKVDFRDNIAVVELNRPKAHALNRALVTELQETFVELGEAKHVEGAILTAQGNIFCAGLDLIELYSYDEDGIADFWERFGRMVRDLIKFPKPLVGAINGHAPAGGCVLAMCCDYRFMAEGQGRIGLNEVAVGVVFPTPVIELARHVLGDTRASDMIFHGALLFPEQAGAFGAVHATVPPEHLMETAEQKLQSWLALPQVPWREAKAVLRAPLLEAINVEFSDGYGATIRHWWSDESRATVAKMIQRLKAKA